MFGQCADVFCVQSQHLCDLVIPDGISRGKQDCFDRFFYVCDRFRHLVCVFDLFVILTHWLRYLRCDLVDG